MSRIHPWERLPFWPDSQSSQVHDADHARRVERDDATNAVKYSARHDLDQVYAQVLPQGFQSYVPSPASFYTAPSPAASYQTAPSPAGSYLTAPSPAGSYRTAHSASNSPAYNISPSGANQQYQPQARRGLDPQYSIGQELANPLVPRFDAQQGNTLPSIEEDGEKKVSHAELDWWKVRTEERTKRLAASRPSTDTAYGKLLAQKSLLVSLQDELNWSGKGQHVEFDHEREVPLAFVRHIGASRFSIVEKVKCRRIGLARKSMRTNRKLQLQDCIGEVEHLHALRHAHIIQLVGTYLCKRTFAILLYPVADCDLERFMQDTTDLTDVTYDAYLATQGDSLSAAMGLDKWYGRLLSALLDSGHERSPDAFPLAWHDLMKRLGSLAKAFDCLAQTMKYIHDNVTRHMDIKPANILMRLDIQSRGWLQPWRVWRVYIADFGISQNFSAYEHSQTDGATPFTKKYCAPEVFAREQYGRKADIFSLGCVFLEMMHCLLGLSLDTFAQERASSYTDESFYDNIEDAPHWINKLQCEASNRLEKDSAGHVHRLIDWIGLMIAKDPASRIDASALAERFDPQANWKIRLEERNPSISIPRKPIQSLAERRPREGFVALPYMLLPAAFRLDECCEAGPEPYCVDAVT